MTWIKVISCILLILFDDTVTILRTLRDSMRTLTGLSGEYVTFDQNGQNAISAEFRILAVSLPDWWFLRTKGVIGTFSQTVRAGIF